MAVLLDQENLTGRLSVPLIGALLIEESDFSRFLDDEAGVEFAERDQSAYMVRVLNLVKTAGGDSYIGARAHRRNGQR